MLEVADPCYIQSTVTENTASVNHSEHRKCVSVPELSEALGPDVLTGVLNASQQVGDELVDGAFVLHGSRDALSHFNFIALAVREQKGEFSLFTLVVLNLL